ncbi:MAG: enoyl-CoA hydratase [Comamonadaceae bacterium]|nr:MAG: enoyl-CoA hydratase [Comamonadaceae bacterium]
MSTGAPSWDDAPTALAHPRSTLPPLHPRTSQSAMTSEPAILLETQADVVHLTFNRPSQRNAVDLAMAERMRELAPRIANTRAKVIVMRAHGPAFMAGGDIASFAPPDADIGAIIDGFHTFVRALAESAASVVARIHGAVAGGGLSLALNADVILAAEDAKFSFAYRRLGTSPDGGCTHQLPRIVGSRRAFALLMMGEAMSARDALSHGLISEVVAPAELEARTRAVTDLLRANAARAGARTRKLLQESQRSTLDEQLDAEREAFLACASTDDFREGVTAFLDKRLPRFHTPEH